MPSTSSSAPEGFIRDKKEVKPKAPQIHEPIDTSNIYDKLKEIPTDQPVMPNIPPIILYTKVRNDAYKGLTGVIQGYRCQQFGHCTQLQKGGEVCEIWGSPQSI